MDTIFFYFIFFFFRIKKNLNEICWQGFQHFFFFNICEKGGGPGGGMGGWVQDWPMTALQIDYVISGSMRRLKINCIGNGQHTFNIRKLWLLNWPSPEDRVSKKYESRLIRDMRFEYSWAQLSIFCKNKSMLWFLKNICWPYNFES